VLLALCSLVITLQQAMEIETFDLPALPPFIQGRRSRLKTVGNKPYDRYFLFADVLTPGKCFVIICAKHSDSVHLLKRVARTGTSVGSLNAIVEPDPITQTMGENSSIYILDGATDYYLLDNDFKDAIPEVPPTIPDANQTLWYCRHGVSTLAFNRVTLQDACCGGTFCDKQQSGLAPTQSCGCLYKSVGHANDKVDCDIILPVPASVDQIGEIIVTHARSYTTTKLIFKEANFSNIDTDVHQQAIQKSANQVVNHINNNKGFTLIGWARTGKVRDASSDANANESIESMEPRFHVSYLYPTDKSIVHKEEFKQCQFQIE
jgi:hypothetical protein